MSKVGASSIVKIIVKCGSCNKDVEPTTIDFNAEIDARSCPGCDGSGGQYTCLCYGSSVNKSLDFQCPECKYYGVIPIV